MSHNDEVMRRFSVVVVHYSPVRDTVRLARHINDFGGDLVDRTYIVSSGSPDPLDIGSLHGRLIVLADNIGFGRSANVGVSYVETEFFLLLNPDIHLTEGSLSEFVTQASNVFDEDSTLGFVSGWFTLPDGSVQDIAGRPPSLASMISPFKSDGILRAGIPEDAAYVDGLSAVGIAVRAEMFRRLGGFDPEFFMYFEDADLFRRARKAGIRSKVLPLLMGTHAVGSSSENRPRLDKMMMVRRSQAYFVEKHYGPVGWHLLRVMLVADGLRLLLSGKATKAKFFDYIKLQRAASEGSDE